MLNGFPALAASLLVRAILAATIGIKVFLPLLSSQTGPITVPAPILVQNNISYGSDPFQKLDLCQPNNTGEKHPAVLLIHGGGGDKSQFTRICKDLANQGIVAAAVNYRESPSPSYEVILADNQLAFEWVQSREYVDPTNMGAWGGSMGGYVASMEGTDESRFPVKVKCVNNNYGPTNFTDPSLWPSTPLIQSLQARFFGTSLNQHSAIFDDLSPITHVADNSAPSWLFTRSVNDQLVPENQMLTMVAALEQYGIRTQTFEYNGAGSGHANDLPADQEEQLYQLRLDYMVDCLAGN